MRPQLPAIGLGTAAIALVPEMDARATLDHALDRGIRYFDTAPLYGGGQAEIRLGQMLRSAPRDVVVSTKCGCRREFGAAPAYRTGQPDKWDFSEAAIRESVERSCERLHRDCLDIVFLHDIHQAQDQALGEALPVLRELQSRGRIAMASGATPWPSILQRSTPMPPTLCLWPDGGRWQIARRVTSSFRWRRRKAASLSWAEC